MAALPKRPSPMNASIRRAVDAVELPTQERCHIAEWSNSADDPALSIAHARVPVGVTTRWHRVAGTVERYVVLQGRGRMEAGGLPPTEVGPGDVVIIPADCAQRIANTGKEDLLFLAICTPRFRHGAYEDIDPAPFDPDGADAGWSTAAAPSTHANSTAGHAP